MARLKWFVLILLAFSLTTIAVFAQDAPLIEPQAVGVSAADDLLLKGDLYVLDSETEMPTVLLMHMLGSNRRGWQLLIPPLLEAGYNVLNVDLRGHGITGGSSDWDAATLDIQTWLDWLREQPGVRDDAISIIGGSIGSNLALIGCANDEACVTAIALSPGLDFRGVMPETAVVEGLSKRSALLIVSQSDSPSNDSVKQMVTNSEGEIGALFFRGSLHGTELLSSRDVGPRVISAIIAWLDDHIPAASET